MIIGVNAIGINVGRLEETGGILTQLGARRIPRSCASPSGDWDVGNLILNVDASQSLELLSPAPKVFEAGLTHICLQSRSAEALKAGLEAQNTRFNADLITLGNGTWYAYGATPAGFVVEVESADYAPDDAPPAWLSHVALCTHDLESMANFYARLTGRPWFGGHRVRRNPANDAITGLQDVDLKVSWVACGNILLEFWQYLNPITRPRSAAAQKQAGLHRIVFEVENLERALPHLVEAGVTMTGDRRDDADGQSSVTGTDPDGNALTFVSYERSPDDARSLARRPEFGWMSHLNEIRANLTTLSFRPRLQW